MGLARVWVKLINALIIVQSLVMIGGAAYIASVSMSSFVYVLGGVGLFLLITGAMGYRLAGAANKAKGCVALYAVMLFTLLALHGAIVIGFLFYEDATIDFLKRLNAHGNNDEIRSYIDNHRRAFKWASLGVVIAEFLAFSAVVCCGAVAGEESEEEPEQYRSLNMDERGVTSAGSNYVEVSATPHTDARRQQLNEKYGGLFGGGRQQVHSTQSFSTHASANV